MSILSFGFSSPQSTISNQRLGHQYQRIPCFDSSNFGSFNDQQIPASEFCVRSAKHTKKNRLLVKSAVDVGVVESEDSAKAWGKSRAFYDAIVIGSGIGGLVAATQLAVKGAKVLVLEKYVIPGGSSGFYKREGFTFDVGSSFMFGFSDKVS